MSRGEILKLLINMPPGHMKSLTTSVFWQAWEWIDMPWTRWLTASYAAPLSTRDSVKTRRVIESRWYQENFGDSFQLVFDQNQKTRFENDKTGYRIATSVDGVATGERGDRVVVDDPHNVKQALSAVQREAALVWWDETMTTRVNDPESSGQVIVMQRLHEQDLAGHILEQGGWEHLMLPMEYEPERKCFTSIGFEDPREKEGELLWPERFGEAVLKDWKPRLGSYAAAGQLQQRPAPRGGGFFERQWFEIVRAAPKKAKRVRYWDPAATKQQGKSDPDWTAGAKVSLEEGIYYIEDMRRIRETPKKNEDLIRQTAELDTVAIDVWMEQEGGASGKNMIDHYARHVLVGFTFRGDPVSGSKEARADPVSAAAEAGNVKLVRGPWNEDFLNEIEHFPTGAHDDQVDAVSGACQKLGGAVAQPWIVVV